MMTAGSPPLEVAPKAPTSFQSFEVPVPLRGQRFTLKQIQRVFNELDEINTSEGHRLYAKLTRPKDLSEADWQERITLERARAFRITTTIIGGEDNTFLYGDDSSIFDSPDIPYPIKRVFFTNETAYRSVSSGTDPNNSLSVWIDFEKPPLLDTNPLVSEPTANRSEVIIKADNVAFLRAVQRIAERGLRRNTLWYSPLHKRLSYDFGLWLFAIPYVLFSIPSIIDYVTPNSGQYALYRLPLALYLFGVGMMLYRGFFSYLKWAFPVNVLDENKDTASKHRAVSWAIVSGLAAKMVYKLLGF